MNFSSALGSSFVDVRVVLAGQRPIGLLYFLLRGVSGHAQNLVVISTRHRFPPFYTLQRLLVIVDFIFRIDDVIILFAVAASARSGRVLALSACAWAW